MSIRDDLRSIVALRPAPPRWSIAIQAGLAIALPIALFTALGHEDLGLLASTGGFLALYLTSRSRRQRAAVLPLIGAVLLGSAAIGVLGSGAVWTSVVALLVLAAGASVLFLGFEVGPPGVLFPVLVGGVAGHLAGPIALGGSGLDGRIVLGAMVIGAVLAYLVVLLPLVLPSVRSRDSDIHDATAGPLRFRLDATTRLIVARVIIAAAIAAIIAVPLGLPRAYWVTLTVVAILQNGHRLRLTAVRAVHRVIGTLLGVGIFALVELLHPSGWVLVLVLGVLQFGIETIVLRNYGLALLLITPLALTISAQGATTPSVLIADRVVDTAVGGAIAMLVLLGSLLRRRVRAVR
ncbi:FUSC family protein [Lacisediminihabitans changchengi]|uniref:FUSC family protein n=1 Tax=Lacisediminihabitans changchengi TaxID=2787634 RepID=A0A934W4K3_9MICO|nr:FUSC family protein [Lacisediminihabitans changchengi]MBK4347580.1 FUSC family protein [Lacisediminihabitans changchengi]